MPTEGRFIDSMLLVLFVAGRTNVRIIEKHQRLDTYSIEDFSRLNDLVAQLGGVVWATPNTLTETSNLLGQHRDPEREQLLVTLRTLISECRELLVHSSEAAKQSLFTEVGLTDATLLEVASPERPLLTMDGRLYAAAIAEEPQRALNFHHFRKDELGTH